jgi:hypothetical protein
MYIKCGCTRELLEIESIYDDQEYVISLYVDCFYEEQKRAYQIIWDRLKCAWFMLSGKKHRLFELCLTKEKFEEFKKEISLMGVQQ